MIGLFFSNQFNFAQDFPNSGITFVAAVCFGYGYFCLARPNLAYGDSHCSRTHIVKFVIFPYFNADGLKCKYLQRLGYRVAALYGLSVVGIGK